MIGDPPRMRMFAGPNGSGKTTVKNGLARPQPWFGSYINPDEIEREIRETGSLSLDQFDLTASSDQIRSWLANSSLLQRTRLGAFLTQVSCHSGLVDFGGLSMNSYYASSLAGFLRHQLLNRKKSFSIETVMSFKDKVELLRDAQAAGYRTYLYYVATEDPVINIERVKYRVSQGGHDVPEEKIISRYHKSLKLLPQAIKHSNRAFLFDTSEPVSWYFAETTDGCEIELKSDEMPNWFEPVWDQF